MKFSTKTTYGLRSLIRLANLKPQENASIAQIAREENISPSYLERIFSLLKKANLVLSEKGVNGGYILARPSSSINLLEIIDILEGNKNSFSCSKQKRGDSCTSNCHCQADFTLVKIQESLNKTMELITLDQLIKN